MKNDLEDLKKALDFPTAGAALQDPKVDKVIQDLVEVNNPLRQNLPRKPGAGSDWILNQRTVRGAAKFVNDTEVGTKVQSTYVQKKFAFKTILYEGAVTRFLLATGRSLTDLEAEEIESGVQDVRDKEESAIFNGDKGSNPKEFDGLRILIPGSQTIVAGANGAALTLDLMDRFFDLNRGRPNILAMSRRTKRQLEALLQAQQRFMTTIEVKGGFRLASFNGVPIFDSIFISDAQTQGTASDASDIFLVDSARVWMGILTELRMKRLADKTSQEREFDIFEDLSLVVANDLFVSRLQGVIP